MTTGSRTEGNLNQVGPYARVTWGGGDNQPSVLRNTRWRDLPPITDMWGYTLTPKDGIEYKMALISAKGRALRVDKTRAPAQDGKFELHPYDKTLLVGLNGPTLHVETGLSYPYAQLFGYYVVEDPWTSNDDLALMSKLREAILGSDLHAGTALVEVDRALKMLRGDLTSLAWALSSFRKGDVKAGVGNLFGGERGRRARESGLDKHVARNYADRQLVWEYGYAPLLHDADAALRFIAWQLNAVPLARFAVSRRLPMTVVPQFPGSGADTGFSFGVSSKRMIAYVESYDLPQLVGLYDIPSMVWERIPGSFLIDWVIPIQSYLSALNTARSLNARYVLTRKVYSQWRPALDQVWSGGNYTGCQKTWFKQMTMSRSVTPLAINHPSIKLAGKIASTGHVLNAVSLLIQQAGKKFSFL